MRTASAVSTFGPVTTGRVCDRRPLNSFWHGLTTLALVVHHSTEKALLVSDNGDAVAAVWVPRSMLNLDKAERSPKFIVATMSAAFANQKRLNVRMIDGEKLKYTAEEQIDLQDAIHCAAQSRIRLRGNRQAELGHGGRNNFA